MVCRNAIRGSRCCSRRISSPSGLLCSSCRLLALKENAKSLEQGFGALVDGHVSGIRHTVRTIKVNLGTVVVICAEMQWLRCGSRFVADRKELPPIAAISFSENGIE